MGNTAPKDSFRLHSLDISIDLLESAVSFSHGMVVLGSWFLCCEMELSTLRVKHLVLDPERKQACMTLSASKTDTVRSMVQRRHAFYYGAVPEAICPYHAALRIADQSPSDPEAFLALCTGLGRAAHQDADHRGHPQWRTFHYTGQELRTSRRSTDLAATAFGCPAPNTFAECGPWSQLSWSLGQQGHRTIRAGDRA